MYKVIIEADSRGVLNTKYEGDQSEWISEDTVYDLEDIKFWLSFIEQIGDYYSGHGEMPKEVTLK